MHVCEGVRFPGAGTADSCRLPGIEGSVEKQLVCLTARPPLQPLERTQWSLKCTFGWEGEAYGIYKQKEVFRGLNLKKLKAYPHFY